MATLVLHLNERARTKEKIDLNRSYENKKKDRTIYEKGIGEIDNGIEKRTSVINDKILIDAKRNVDKYKHTSLLKYSKALYI